MLNYIRFNLLVSEKVLTASMAILCFMCKITDSESILFTTFTSNEIRFVNLTDNSKYDSTGRNIYLKEAAKTIGVHLKQTSGNELGNHIIQDIYTSIKSQDNKNFNDKTQLNKLSKKIERKLVTVLTVFNETIKLIEEYANRSESLIHYDCSGVFSHNMSSGCEVSQNISTLSPSLCSSLNISEVFQMHRENHAAIKNEYFLPAGDDYRTCTLDKMFKFCMSVYNDYCQPLNDPFFEQIYLKSIDHSQRRMIVIIDHGSSISYNQLAVAKALSKYIVASLGPGDKICIISLSEASTSICDDESYCENRNHLLNFIDSIKQSKGITNHSLGFDHAFKLISREMHNLSTDSFISLQYISKGLLSSIMEPKTVLEVIANGRKSIIPRVIINTCALIDDWKPVIYERHFLRDIAHQNYYKYNITVDVPFLLAGVMEEISAGADTVLPITLGPVVRRLMGTMRVDDHISNRINFFLPQLDEVQSDPVITVSKVVRVKHAGVIGVAAMQVFLEDIFEEIIHFNQNGFKSYTFVISVEGYILMHPLLRRAGYYYERPWVNDLSFFDIVENITVIQTMILKKDFGEVIAKQKEGKLVKYSWQKLENAPYIVITVSEMDNSDKLDFPLQFEHSGPQSDVCNNDCDLVFNKLDYLISGQYALCRYLNDLTTLDAGNLFLSASCFQSPFKYLLSDKNASYFNIQNYMAYIKDKTKLLANPGLKSGIRAEIIALSTIIPHWRKQFFSSTFNRYIIRRYIATGSGVFITYPGTQIHHRFDPVRSVWFTNAVNNPSKLMLTARYPDTYEEGYIVTISQAFISAPTGINWNVVVAFDVTFGYLQEILTDVLPYCSLDKNDNDKIRCFVMDDRGYLLSHPSLSGPSITDSNGKPPFEGQHITYKESLVANDILNHKEFVEKLVCSDISTGSIQRYYRFNNSVTSVISNIISGDQCIKYQLVAVPSTNIFVGVVNTTCDDTTTAFCPCSRIDRHCLNCGKMEQTACECPCECPVNIECNVTRQTGHRIPPCAYNSVPFNLNQNVHHHSLITKVKPCFLNDCEKHLTQRSCLSVVGCKWCQYKVDQITQLPNPFCTVQPLCFNGVLASNIPYGERSLRGSAVKEGSGLHTTSKTSSTGAIGATGGAVIALLFALLLMCYFYHKRSQIAQVPRNDHNCMRPISLFALEKNNNNSRIIEEPPTEPHNGLLQSAQEVSVALLTPVSPYLMNTSYCRPPTGDSDHGYSTMTPHEDTDHIEAEPSVPIQQQTLLSHHILAPVTVHMVMDT